VKAGFAERLSSNFDSRILKLEKVRGDPFKGQIPNLMMASLSMNYPP
jgi:hypothetical protein